MATHAAQARIVLDELDRRTNLLAFAQERASFWHELFVVQSIEEYLLFLWLEADDAERQGTIALSQIEPETEAQERAVQQEAALAYYRRAAIFRGGIVALLQLDYHPFLPAWIDASYDRWYGWHEKESAVAFPCMDNQELETFAERETSKGNVVFFQLRHAPSDQLYRQAIQHYQATALARRQLIGGWLLEYAVGKPRMTIDALDLADLGRLTQHLQEVQATIARLTPQTGESSTDDVGQVFHLGMVGSGRHTRALNAREMAALERIGETANKLAPLYRKRTHILKQIEEVWSGRNQRWRERKAAEEEWVRQAQQRVQNAQKGGYVRDKDFGVVRVVRRNKKSLTIETKSGYREARPFDHIIDLAPAPSQSTQETSEQAASEGKPSDHLNG